MAERKMAFHELHGGKMALEFQEAFETVQRVAFQKCGPASASLTITVLPPHKDNEGYGKVRYAISITEPKAKSPELFTRLNGCYIAHDAKEMSGVDQLNLEFASKGGAQ